MQQSYVGYDHQTSARGHSTRIKIVQKGAEKKRKTGENCERRSRNA